jgi:hypothetical protein
MAVVDFAVPQDCPAAIAEVVLAAPQWLELAVTAEAPDAVALPAQWSIAAAEVELMPVQCSIAAVFAETLPPRFEAVVAFMPFAWQAAACSAVHAPCAEAAVALTPLASHPACVAEAVE